MKREKVIEDLENAIARRIYEPGGRLVEAQLCKRYRVGRTIIREVLRRLEQDGFVKITPNSGASVSELSQKEIENIYDLMGTLEGLAMRIATPSLGKKEVDTIEKFIKKMGALNNPYHLYENNFKFHCFMDSLSENERLIKFIRNLRAQAMRISLRSFYNPGQVKESKKEHQEIFEAIKEGDPIKVENSIRNHYLQSKNRLFKYLNKSL